jgi:hypothetical protein
VAGVVAGRNVHDRVTWDLHGVDAVAVGGDVGEDHRITASSLGAAESLRRGGPGVRAGIRVCIIGVFLGRVEIAGIGTDDEDIRLIGEFLGNIAAVGAQR